MMCKLLSPISVVQLFTMLLYLAGCSTTVPVKHLSSDVCLVMPESTTKTEVLSFLGEPDQKKTSDNGDEIWIYYKEDKDLIRNIPIIGDKLGLHNYEVVTVTFAESKVRTCVYRQLDPAEFSNINQEIR